MNHGNYCWFIISFFIFTAATLQTQGTYCRNPGNAKTGILSGYLIRSSRINRMFNFILALSLIIISLPGSLIIYLIIRLVDGKPVFYRGIRLGLNKRPFFMYKFRTLKQGAEKEIGAALFSESGKNNLETPLGRFLRSTRLDELPQLFNILRGDMNFLGPRPERPVVYEKYCRNIPGYDKRFSVKPGMIGYSQLLTPHSTPKKIRTLIDNKFLEKEQSILWICLLVVVTILVVTEKVYLKITGAVWYGLFHRAGRVTYHEKRLLERRKIKDARVYINWEDTGREVFVACAKLININEDAFLINSNRKLNEDVYSFKLETSVKSLYRRSKIRTKTALCSGTVLRKPEEKNGQDGYSYVVKYTPVSALNAYLIDNYFLGRSLMSL